MSREIDHVATVCEHLSVEELEARYAGCQDATASRHFQVICLLARGRTVSQVSATTAFGERWIEQLLARYNAEGPEALGDLRLLQRKGDNLSLNLGRDPVCKNRLLARDFLQRQLAAFVLQLLEPVKAVGCRSGRLRDYRRRS